MYAKANRDKAYSLLSYSRPLEASINAVTALKAPWILPMYDQEGYGYQEIRLVEGERLLDLGRSSRRDQDPTPKLIPAHAGTDATYPLR